MEAQELKCSQASVITFVHSPTPPPPQVSRLQNGADISREVHSLAKDELRHVIDYYMLYWPERRVG